MSINKHFIRLRIATYSFSASILTSIILFLSKIKWRIFFTTYYLPLINLPLSKVLQPLSLSFNYIKVIITAHDLISSGIATLNKILTLIGNAIQSILNTVIMLGIFSVIVMPAFTISILMVCTATLGILINLYSLIENIVLSCRNTDPTQNEKLKLTTINSAVTFTMSAIVSASLGVLLFFSGIGGALLLAIGIGATTTLITGTIITSFLGYKLSAKENIGSSLATTPLQTSIEKQHLMQETQTPTQTINITYRHNNSKQGFFAGSNKKIIKEGSNIQDKLTIRSGHSIFH